MLLSYCIVKSRVHQVTSPNQQDLRHLVSSGNKDWCESHPGVLRKSRLRDFVILGLDADDATPISVPRAFSYYRRDATYQLHLGNWQAVYSVLLNSVRSNIRGDYWPNSALTTDPGRQDLSPKHTLGNSGDV